MQKYSIGVEGEKKKNCEFSNYLLEEFRVGRVVVLGLVLSGGGRHRRLQRRQ